MSEPEQSGLRARFRVIQGGRGLPEPLETELPSEPSLSLFSDSDRVERLLGPLLVLLLFTLLRLVFASIPGLAADEAYYWSWSKALDSGYYDHPPAVAWLIFASTSILGDTELGVRAGSVLLGSVALLALLLVSRRPWLTLAVALSTPLFVFGGLLATPDIPLIFGWTVALAAAARGGRWWLLAGAAAGFASMGKLNGLLLYPLLFLGSPGSWRSRWPYLGAAILGLAILPNWIWLAGHDWVTLRFQFEHGLGGDRPMAGIGGLASFFGGQLALVTPLHVFAILLFWAVAWREKGMARLIWWSSCPVLILFAGTSLFSASEANWPAAAWLGGMLGLGYLSDRWRRLVWVGVGMSSVLTVLVGIHLIHPIVAIQRDPTMRLAGGEFLGRAVDAWGIETVYTERYQEAAWIRFYTGIQATVLPGVGRRSQFDLWPRERPADHALYVRTWHRWPARRIAALWETRDGPNTVVARDALDRTTARWQIYELRGALHPDWETPSNETPSTESQP